MHVFGEVRVAHGDRKAMVLGGSGLVGYQVARRLALGTDLESLIVVARWRGEADQAVADLGAEFPRLDVRGYHGDIFLPGELVPAGKDAPSRSRASEAEFRRRLFDDVYTDFESAYQDAMLVRLLSAERPDVIVDCVNTATGISYQDVFTTCLAVRADLDNGPGSSESLRENVERLMVSLSIPQLILRIRLLYRSLAESGARLYLKVGTTGTGGMGLNIPYTHGEERPSPQLLNKTAVAFAHTGMLFLMARTPGSPIIKEVKPAALIGYRGVDHRAAMGRQFRKVTRDGETVFELGDANEPYLLYKPRKESLGAELDLTPDASSYERMAGADGKSELRVPLVDTGENGLFTLGEFEAITALDQMEFITPEEIADIVVLEVKGVGTGRDVVSAIDSSVLGSTYKAGLLRPAALTELARLEDEHGVPSIALGRLGPPGLAKHLFEAYLFRRTFKTLDRVLARSGEAGAAEAVSREFSSLLEAEPLIASLCTSIGIPILGSDGKTLWRGPMISAPPYRVFRKKVPVTAETLERYVETWVDLRPERVRWWFEAFRQMQASGRSRPGEGLATARVSHATYLSDDIEIGNVVAWIFSTREEGFRVL
jgi:hypothetical protein